MILNFNNNILLYNNRLVDVVSTSNNSIIGAPYSLLNTITGHLRNYMSDFRNPSFYSYTLDGDQYQILDGTGDLFDTGNYTAPWLLSNTTYTGSTTIPIPPALGYSVTAATLTDTSFYYASLGYSTSPDRRPLTMLGSRSTLGATVGFQKAGNNGADGSGSLVSGFIYTGQTLSGFTVHSYYRQTYANDPAVCDVYILLGHSNWGSQFGTVIGGSYPTSALNGGFLFTSGATVNNILAITTLLSRPFSTPIPVSDIQTVVQKYIIRIKEVLNY
jgi:hypothetical protein